MPAFLHPLQEDRLCPSGALVHLQGTTGAQLGFGASDLWQRSRGLGISELGSDLCG